MARTAHEELAALREQAAAEKGRARDAALRLQAAKAKQADARERLVAAHDRGDHAEIGRAEKAIKQGEGDIELVAAEVEGLARRAQRAEQAVANFELTDNERLLDELEPEAIKVRDELAALLAAIPEAAAAYNAVVTEATRLVTVTGKYPRQEGPHGHGLDQLLHKMKQELNGKEIPVPLPDWRYTKWQAEQAEEQARRQRRDAEMAA